MARSRAAQEAALAEEIVSREDFEMECLATWLDSRRIDGRPLLWFHPVNEGKRSWNQGKKLKRQGLKKGVPDAILIDVPAKAQLVAEARCWPNCRGVAVELKAKDGKLSDEQRAWLGSLNERRWLTGAFWGFDQARRWLEGLGY